MMFISNKKLGDPYRRIIFGISFFDLIQSLSLVLRIFKSTPEHPHTWIDLGNQTSCNILGFMYFAGINGAILYNVSLNIYYVCLIKYNMTASYFRLRIEPFLLGVPAIWAIVSASIIVGTGHMNPAYVGECRIAPYPHGCLKNPDMECIRGQDTNLYRTLFRVVPTFGSLVAILVTLGMLWWSVRAQERRMDRYRMSMYSLRMRGSISADQEEDARIPWFRRLGGNRESQPTQLPRRRSFMRYNNGRQFLIQASSYLIVFLLTHGAVMVAVVMDWGGRKPPFPLIFTARTMETLQGLFNIIVYTRPHVHKERRRNPTFGWWGAFKFVVASGGDDDDERTNRFREGIPRHHRRRSNLGSSRTHATSRRSTAGDINATRNNTVADGAVTN